MVLVKLFLLWTWNWAAFGVIFLVADFCVFSHLFSQISLYFKHKHASTPWFYRALSSLLLLSSIPRVFILFVQALSFYIFLLLYVVLLLYLFFSLSNLFQLINLKWEEFLFLSFFLSLIFLLLLQIYVCLVVLFFLLLLFCCCSL